MRAWTTHTARLLATFAHDGQVDAAGQAYIGHPARVARMSRHAAVTTALDLDLVEMVGWLHDVVEDEEHTGVTIHDLARWGCPDVVLHAVGAISKRPDESRLDYYARVKRNPYALVVKREDVRHNADPRRLAEVAKTDPERAERLRAKYDEAERVLGDG